MRRILLGCALVAVLPVSVAAAAARTSAPPKPGYVVVRRAFNDGGVGGNPVVTVVVRGFVLGRVSQEAEVEIYHLPSPSEQGGPQVKGTDISSTPVRWHGLRGKRYSGSNFRFRATGGLYRVVVRGSRVYVFAGGSGTVWLQGSSADPRRDGMYSVNDSRFRSLPERLLKRKLGGG
jgi:hypothetical protein